MMYSLKVQNNVEKFLRKTKEQPLIDKIRECFREIVSDPYAGDKKSGDLREIYTRKFTYAKVSYRIAYEIDENGKIIIILLATKRENFYDELRRIL